MNEADDWITVETLHLQKQHLANNDLAVAAYVAGAVGSGTWGQDEEDVMVRDAANTAMRESGGLVRFRLNLDDNLSLNLLSMLIQAGFLGGGIDEDADPKEPVVHLQAVRLFQERMSHLGRRVPSKVGGWLRLQEQFKPGGDREVEKHKKGYGCNLTGNGTSAQKRKTTHPTEEATDGAAHHNQSSISSRLPRMRPGDLSKMSLERQTSLKESHRRHISGDNPISKQSVRVVSRKQVNNEKVATPSRDARQNDNSTKSTEVEEYKKTFPNGHTTIKGTGSQRDRAIQAIQNAIEYQLKSSHIPSKEDLLNYVGLSATATMAVMMMEFGRSKGSSETSFNADQGFGHHLNSTCCNLSNSAAT
ncbi:hypothetical protein ONS96_005292 [Cadophora gregata f. sp. sojae]|nr:hypothetical protein ONS96_005292 [Cadophora gregata f. sp. sojae]